MEGLKKGAWSSEEDELLIHSVKLRGEGKWRSLAQKAGLNRSGRSCRLRWLNYLRPGIKRGDFSADEEELIIKLHRLLGNRWVLIAGRLPGRTDNEIKNYWNTILVKRIQRQTRQSDHSKLSKIRRFQSHTSPNISEVQARDHEEVGFSVGQSLSHSSHDVPENDFHSFNFGSWNEHNNIFEIENGEETEPMKHMELKTIASLLDIEKELRELL